MRDHASIIDARTDQRWVAPIQSLIALEDWAQLWLLAQKTPPIWAVRILKFLNKRGWKPEPEAQLDFFNSLSQFAAACNEFDLPVPETRSPHTVMLGTGRKNIAPSRITTARVTADGEFAYFLDGSATCIEIRRLDDLSEVELIRLDMLHGKSLAVLAIAVTQSGDRIATLTYETIQRQSALHIFDLVDGELERQRSIASKFENLGMQVPRLAFTANGKGLVTHTAMNLISIWDIDRGTIIRHSEALNLVKKVAAKMGVPYQTYIKQVLYKQAIQDLESIERTKAIAV